MTVRVRGLGHRKDRDRNIKMNKTGIEDQGVMEDVMSTDRDYHRPM